MPSSRSYIILILYLGLWSIWTRILWKVSVSSFFFFFLHKCPAVPAPFIKRLPLLHWIAWRLHLKIKFLGYKILNVYEYLEVITVNILMNISSVFYSTSCVYTCILCIWNPIMNDRYPSSPLSSLSAFLGQFLVSF